MIVSFTELDTMAKRAARGIGMSWGLADEAGKAAAWLGANGQPGPEAIAATLASQEGVDRAELTPMVDADVWEAPGGVLCPVTTGAAICDRAVALAAGAVIELGRISHPALLGFHVASAAKVAGVTLELSWAGASLIAGPDGARFSGADDDLGAASADSVRCSLAEQPEAVSSVPSTRRDVAADVWAQLTEFAMRSFAPSTEESRMSGAGAGLIDDD